MEFFRGQEKEKLKTVLEKAPSMQRPPIPDKNVWKLKIAFACLCISAG
jgi:hypothetical protein